MATIDIFWSLGNKIKKHETQESISLGYHKFRAFFGTPPVVCLIVWDLLFIHRPPKSTPDHLLWALMLLKRYHIESVNATLAGVDEKTFHKLSHNFISLLSNLPLVKRVLLTI